MLSGLTTGPWWPYLLLLAAAVLLSSGGLKLLDRTAFARAVEGFSVLPPGLGRLAGRVLPVAELALGLLVLVTSGVVWDVVAWVRRR